jgi:hypothetical protein
LESAPRVFLGAQMIGVVMNSTSREWFRTGEIVKTPKRFKNKSRHIGHRFFRGMRGTERKAFLFTKFKDGKKIERWGG